MRAVSWAIAALFLCIASSATAQSPLTNGGFEDPANPLSGWQVQGNVSVHQTGSGNHAVQLAEPASGAVSRIFQEFDIPPNPAVLTFDYRFIHGQPSQPGFHPPDSFSVFLLDAGEPLVVPYDPQGSSNPDPGFTKALFYADSNGLLLFDSSVVTHSCAGPTDLCDVAIDLSSLTAGVSSARIEFGLASFNNGIASTVFLDGVAMPCPAVEIVFIMDTSPSMDLEAAALCSSIQMIEAQLEDQLEVEVTATLWGITHDGCLACDDAEDPGYPNCASWCNDDDGDEQFRCLTSDVFDEFSQGNNNVDIPSDGSSDNGDCHHQMLGPPSDTDESENWGSATTVVADVYKWPPPTESVRLIIPISDEGPCMGGADAASACATSDGDAIANAIYFAGLNEVVVSPIIAMPNQGSVLPCLFNTNYVSALRTASSRGGRRRG